jgi:hypothetical protein
VSERRGLRFGFEHGGRQILAELANVREFGRRHRLVHHRGEVHQPRRVRGLGGFLERFGGERIAEVRGRDVVARGPVRIEHGGLREILRLDAHQAIAQRGLRRGGIRRVRGGLALEREIEGLVGCRRRVDGREGIFGFALGDGEHLVARVCEAGVVEVRGQGRGRNLRGGCRRRFGGQPLGRAGVVLEDRDGPVRNRCVVEGRSEILRR